MALVIVLAGCGSTAPTPTTPPATPTATAVARATTASAVVPSASAVASGEAIVGAAAGSFVVISRQTNSPYFDLVFAGAQGAAFQLGGTVSQPLIVGVVPPQGVFIQTATTQGARAIIIAPDDPTADAPAMEQAMAAGVKVVGFDSSPVPGSYDVFVAPVDDTAMGGTLAQMACDEAPNCTGEIAILSAAQGSTDQNVWIAAMRTALASSKYAGLKLDGIYYGDDDPRISTRQTQAMLAAHPNLKVIVAPTTVGIVAAAQVVTAENKTGQVLVTGVGTPQDMAVYGKSGVAPEFALWNLTDLGYLAYAVAVGLVTGQIKGKVGETFTVPSDPSLNDGRPYTIGADNVVVAGAPFIFYAQNVDQYLIPPFGF